jgi:GDP-L-fucose synthase
MVGSAIVKKLKSVLPGAQILEKNRADLDLLSQEQVHLFLQSERPDYVFIAAAKVGGILANNSYRAQFLYENLMIETNLIHGAYQAGIKNLMFLGSSCIYPRDCPQPMKEEHLLTGALEKTNEPYAIAKIAGIKLCENYNSQYGTNYISLMPTNLYGPGDNYDLTNSHVLPALIRKAHHAKEQPGGKLVVWGSGTPRREFLFVDDLALACVHFMALSLESVGLKLNNAELDGSEASPKSRLPVLLNVGYGSDLSIADAAGLVAEIVGFRGEIMFDETKSDGHPKKLLDSSLALGLGWKPRVSLETGIRETYADFLQNVIPKL